MRISESEKLRNILFARMAEIELKPADIIKDAEERGIKINASSFSKYKKGLKGGLTDEQVFYLCQRLYVPVHIFFGNPELKGTKITWVIPPYNELEVVKNLNKIFAHGEN